MTVLGYLDFMSEYDRFPKTKISGYDHSIFDGYERITEELRLRVKGKKVLTIETYPGVRIEELLEQFIAPLEPSDIIFAEEAAMDGKTINEKIQPNLTKDRVFGFMTSFKLVDFFIPSRISKFQERIKNTNGLTVVVGVGASLISRGDIMIYCDLARWEIQQRYRSGELANWKDDNYDDEKLSKYKRGYFVDWRLADRLKKKLFYQTDYFLDTTIKNQPKMVTGEAFHEGMKQLVSRPFRLVPYFDPGVWGGQWMKEVCQLPEDSPNYAWSFDGVPEENSIYLQYGDKYIEFPSINLVFLHPIELLGDKVHARFGTEFPIRFDFLDTMQGQNLSLQVHPLTEYIQEQFGMHYTQDESYYILDAAEDGAVYLGVKENIDPQEMITDLERAQAGDFEFPAEKYVNVFKTKKHDHFLIPAGTVHCSGKNTMVLEISATPYIFTFKLWDWGRVDLDGKPRPIHIEHGKQSIQFQRDTSWVEKNLINRFEPITETDRFTEEKTGLHERQFIETRRYTIRDKVIIDTDESVNMLNLIDGKAAVIESPENHFAPFVVHYAETFIVPEKCRRYSIRPVNEGEEIRVIRAYVRV